MAKNTRYFIFGRSSCPFCIMAVDYCKLLKMEHVFCDYETRQHILEEYKDFYKQETVPIVLENNKDTGYTRKVGGYSELVAETTPKKG
jgi:glutaredoxin